MPFYWEIKRRARLLGFIVLGIAALYAAWHFAPTESARDNLVAEAGYLGKADKAGFEAKYGALGGEL